MTTLKKNVIAGSSVSRFWNMRKAYKPRSSHLPFRILENASLIAANTISRTNRDSNNAPREARPHVTPFIIKIRTIAHISSTVKNIPAADATIFRIDHELPFAFNVLFAFGIL